MSAPRVPIATRVRRIRANRVRGAFAYRQRNLAAGAWFGLRRLLAGAEAAFSLSAAEIAALTAAGHRPAEEGLRFEPPLSLFVVSKAQIERVGDATPLPVRLSAELLGARAVALIPFELRRSTADASPP